MDDRTVYAVTRALEVIGEATRCIPRQVRERYPSLPWSEMAGMRDKLIHAYFGINRAIIWRTLRDDIPPPRSAVQRLLDDPAVEEETDLRDPGQGVTPGTGPGSRRCAVYPAPLNTVLEQT